MRGPLGRWRHRLTLHSHRQQARIFWPDATGIEIAPLAFWLAFLRIHEQALHFVCVSAPAWRRWRKPRAAASVTRVLHVTCSFDLGGSQTQIKNLCTDAGGAGLVHEAIEIFPEVNFLFRQGVGVDSSRYGGAGLFRRAAGRLVTYPGTRSSQLVQIYKLLQDMRASRPDVVVAWGHELCMLTFVAATLARVPHIVFCIRTFNPAYGWMEPAMGRLARVAHGRMQPLLSSLIVNSTPLKHDYSEWLGIDPSVVSVCANGIDQATVEGDKVLEYRTRIRAEYGIASDALVLIHVGRFSAEKGQMSLMQANLALLAKYPDRPFVWLLCGDGVTLPEAQAFVSAHGVTNVVFVGRTSDVPAFLCAADIFVMPSDFEGMPNAMMEAMAQGLPCVSTDRSGAVDIARDGIEALYYAPRDVPRLVEHLARLFDHPEERRALGRRAQARMMEFSVQRSVETFEGLLAALEPASPRRARADAGQAAE